MAAFNPVLGVDWGTTLPDGNVSYYLYTAGETAPDPDVANTDDPNTNQPSTAVDWNAYEQGQLQAAFASFAAVANLQFSQVPQADGATFRLMLSSFDPGTAGYFMPPGETDAGFGNFNLNGTLTRTAAGNTLQPGGDAFDTLIHEIGHGLGLKHPHDTGGGTNPAFPGVTGDQSVGTYGLNQSVYTIMSYVPGWTTGPDGPSGSNDYGQPMTPMAFDIAALQAKYGANMSYHTGDDDYVLPGQDGVGTGYSCIWDAGGTNTISYAGPGAAVINLNPASLAFAPDGGGAVSYVKGVHGGFTIAHGVTIQRAVGGSGDDLLVANNAGDFLDPGAGNNTVLGGSGADTVSSTTGNDEIFAGGGQSSVQLGSGTDTVISGSGAATVSAGAGTAVVFGGNGASRAEVFGGTGKLSFVGGAGTETVIGGAGGLAAFSGASSGEFFGSAHGNDLLCAGTGAVTLVGGGGSGEMFSSDRGGNVLVAGAGNETLVGSAARGGDVLFTGGAGTNDVIWTNHGADSVYAGTGNATINGGATPDSYVFADGKAGGAELIYNFNPGSGIALRGYGASELDAAMASARRSGNSTTFHLSDNTRITLVGVTGLERSMFT